MIVINLRQTCSTCFHESIKAIREKLRESFLYLVKQDIFIDKSLLLLYLIFRTMPDDQTANITKGPADPLIQALDKLGSGSNFLWIIFIFTLTPTIFNGMHSMSYIFIAEVSTRLR